MADTVPNGPPSNHIALYTNVFSVFTFWTDRKMVRALPRHIVKEIYCDWLLCLCRYCVELTITVFAVVFHMGNFTFFPSFIRKNKKILFIFYMECGVGFAQRFSLLVLHFVKPPTGSFLAHASAPWAGAFHMLSWYDGIHLRRHNFSFRENTFLCAQDLHLFVSACVLTFITL